MKELQCMISTILTTRNIERMLSRSNTLCAATILVLGVRRMRSTKILPERALARAPTTSLYEPYLKFVKQIIMALITDIGQPK